ncbi:MAG: TRAP transporter large permease subunit [Salinarimonadaceae bacterium]|nr:MAG: TRAP transporter large permease subunit [Salinarimonadaceae bacterium]
MDIVTYGLILAALVLVLLGSGLWVALSLVAVGLFALEGLLDRPAGRILATQLWSGANSWSLTALPLFIWMGEILFRSQLPQQMFGGVSPWVTRLPGRLMHVNVLASAIFAAVSGSSAATCATVGKITLPELAKRGYDDRLVLGSLAASGTLGLMIPPSIIMIVYGVAAEVSISRLFIAGIAPALLLIVMFMAYIMIWSLLNPDKVPAEEGRMSFFERVRASSSLIPVFLLIGGVIGSIYTGLATASEAAVIGVAGSLVLSAAFGSLNWTSFKEGVISATLVSAMIVLILVAAKFLSVAMGFTGIPRGLASLIAYLELSHYTLLLILALVFIILGCFLDGISIVVLTAAVVLPLVQTAGIDLIWFGIFTVIIVEISALTPPIGFNLFVLQGMSGKPLNTIIAGTIPFFLLMCLSLVIITVFPEIVMTPLTWMGR